MDFSLPNGVGRSFLELVSFSSRKFSSPAEGVCVGSVYAAGEEGPGPQLDARTPTHSCFSPLIQLTCSETLHQGSPKGLMSAQMGHLHLLSVILEYAYIFH